MTVVKKKIKRVETKNPYIPHKIRSHPFYFISLPLKITFFFIFYWIVLVPVLYYIFLTHIAGFPVFAPYFYLLMFGVFLLMMALFIMQWRLKRNKEKTEIYYIKYETPDLTHNFDEKKSLLDIKQQPEEQMVRQKSREMIFLSDKKQNIESQRTVIIEDNNIQQTIYLRETTKRAQRPISLLIEENTRPVSQNLNSPLSPRELFFLDMYEYANKAMRDVTAGFIERERLYYVPSGPVSRLHSETSSLSDSQMEQYSVDEYPPREKWYLDNSLKEQYPTNEQYSTDEQYPIERTSVGNDHSRLAKLLEEYSVERGRKFGAGKIKVKEIKGEKEYFIANVVPKNVCVTEAFLFVDEKKSAQNPKHIVVEVRESR